MSGLTSRGNVGYLAAAQAHAMLRCSLLCLLFATPLLGLGSCKAAGVPIPTVERAIKDAVTVAYHSGVERLEMEIFVAYSTSVGKGGTAFASTATGASTGSVMTLELTSKAAIAEAHEAIRAAEFAKPGLGSLAELDQGTGKIKTSRFDEGLVWRLPVDEPD